MRRRKIFHCAAVGIAGLGLTMPPAMLAAERTPTAAARQSSHLPAVSDVALRAGGLLPGRVVNAQGAPAANEFVAVQFDGRTVATAKSDTQGYFAVRGLRGGTYRVAAAGGSGIYRLWAENSAPPAARPSVLIVADSEIATDQHSAWGLRVFGPRLLILGIMGGVATSGAIVHNEQRPSG
jgi:hypothetical protein